MVALLCLVVAQFTLYAVVLAPGFVQDDYCWIETAVRSRDDPGAVFSRFISGFFRPVVHRDQHRLRRPVLFRGTGNVVKVRAELRLFGLPLAQNTQAYDLVFSASTVLGFYLECVRVAAVLYLPTLSGHPSPKTPGGERITETIEMWLLSVLPTVAPFRIAP